MSYAIDYLAVLGKDGNGFECEQMKSLWEENSLVSPSDVWDDAITDILVINDYNRDNIDDSWTIISQSIDGVEFSELSLFITIAYKRRRDSKRLDHISQVTCQIWWHSGSYSIVVDNNYFS